MRPGAGGGGLRWSHGQSTEDRLGEFSLHSKGERQRNAAVRRTNSPLPAWTRSPFFWWQLAVCVKLTIVMTIPYAAWCSLGESQTVTSDKPHQVRKGDSNSCTSADLLSCPWLRMSRVSVPAPPQTCRQIVGGRGGREDRRWGGRDNKAPQFTVTLQTHLGSPNHPSPSS